MVAKKKKRTVANPARGVATTSLPSKHKDTKPQNSDEVEQKTDSLVANDDVNVIDKPLSELAKCSGQVQIESLSPEALEAHFEQAELQSLIDSHASRVSNEVSRQVTRLNNEKRHLRESSDKLMSETWLTDVLIEDALNESSASTADRLRPSNSPLGVPKDENEMLVAAWILQDTLTKLQMPRVEDVLSYVLRSWFNHCIVSADDLVTGLSEAFEWYARNVNSEELPTYGSNTKRLSTPSHPRPEHGPNDQVVSHADSLRAGKDVAQTRPGSPVEVSRTILSDTPSDDDDDPEHLVDKWLQLQGRMFELEHTEEERSIDKTPRKSKVLRRIHAIERDVLFDRDSAMIRWQSDKQDLEKAVAQARKHKNMPTNVDSVRVDDDNLTNAVDNSMEDADFVLGDIFQELDPGIQLSTNEASDTIVTVHDFGAWTGAHPRVLLEQQYHSENGKSPVTFKTLAKSSMSCRSALDLRVSKHHTADELVKSCLPTGTTFGTTSTSWIFTMEAIAAKDVKQSEALLATTAIFALNISGIIDKSNFSRLPKVWKALVDDMEDSRREAFNIQLQERLRRLQSLIRENRNSDKVIERVEIQKRYAEKSVPSFQTLHPRLGTRMSCEKIKNAWHERVSAAPYQKMLAARTRLPVSAHKDEIIQSFHDNQVLIICADTGAGKSTQIPSYLLEAHHLCGLDVNIMVTQPRRISAISIARRVSQELGEGRADLGSLRSLVGYAIRLESKTSRSTRITFATTGVLLRMMQDSATLEHLDCLVLDEVHERTMDLDLLFIALRRLQERRKDLKIVLMSATVDASKFSRYFGNAPILDIPGRTFPVEVGFLEDAFEATKDVEEHPGMRDEYEDNIESGSETTSKDRQQEGELDGYSSGTRARIASCDQRRIPYQLICNLAKVIAVSPKYVKYSKAILIFMPGIAEIRKLFNMILSSPTFSKAWTIHMLHSSFSTEELEKAFEEPAGGHRKIVIATNIAETGITIPDVTAVIDSCKEKIMRFDEKRQMSRLTEGFISRSSARQRKGRAARVQDGICFHLVTSYTYDHKMLQQTIPEILRLSLQEPILRVKTWNLGSIEETLSDAIDPPTAKNVKRAISKLQDAGALSNIEELTDLGRLIAKLPMDVTLSRLAIFGLIFQCLDSVITIIAMMSLKTIFQSDQRSGGISSQAVFATDDSDLLTLYSAYLAYCKARSSNSAYEFCRKYHLNLSILSQIEEQRLQLFVYMTDAGLVGLSNTEKADLNHARQSNKSVDNFRMPTRYSRLDNSAVRSAVISMAFYPKLLRKEGRGYRQIYTNQQLQISSNSVNYLNKRTPQWMCYMEAMQGKTGKTSAISTSRIAEAAMIVLLGDAEFKLYAGVISIDNGRMKFLMKHWRQVLALQNLRQHLAGVITRMLKEPCLPMSERDQSWLDLTVAALEGPTKSPVNREK